MTFIDYIIILIKWKNKIILSFIITGLLIYPVIRFGIEEEFDAEALILPSEDSSLGGLSGLLKGLSSLPVDMLGEQSTEVTLYNNIIYSRTTLSKIIDEFNLIDNYGIDTSNAEFYELALKELKDKIDAKETLDFAYKIKTRANNPKLAADLANFIVDHLNQTIIELKIEKSKDNREFLEKRLSEIRLNLTTAEDSMLKYQKRTGILNAEEQIKGLISTYSLLETELIKKEIEKTFYSELVSKDSPTLNQINVGLEAFQNKMTSIKKNGSEYGILTSINGLPDKVVEYIRLYRDIKINSSILEFVIPLYEQAKFDEQKDIPVFQVLDRAIPPAKKSYPPRALLTLTIAFLSALLTFMYAIIRENEEWNKSEKVKFIKRNLFKWNSGD